VGTLIVFVILVIAALTLDDDVLERWLQPLSNLGLFLIALGGVLLGRPFVREYAEDSVDAKTATTDGFRYITNAMTWMWVVAFGGMTVLSVIPPLVDGDATIKDDADALSIICYWVAPFTLLGIAAAVSSVFPNWFENRSNEVTARDEVPDTIVDQPAGLPDISDAGLGITAPATSRHDESFGLRVTGVGAGERVVLSASGTDLFGRHWRGQATFVASTDGAVDVSRDVPQEGDWSIADPDAPLWAMQPDHSDTTEGAVADLFVPPAGPWRVTLEATTAAGRVRRTVSRLPAEPGVDISELEIGGRPALLATPSGKAPAAGWPAVACFGGSEGGVDSQRATIATLASNGFAALAYSWVDESTAHAEEPLAEIPLERFADAIATLTSLPGVDRGRITAMGISRGAEGLVAAATHTPLPVSGLVLVSPSSVSWQAIGPDGEIPETPSWTSGGEPVPWVPLPTGALMPQLIRNAWRVHRDIAHGRPSLLKLRAAYTAGLDELGPIAGAPARLRSEAIDVPLLCITGSDDQLWPSERMAGELLAARNHPLDQHVHLDGAGHLIRLGMFPGTAQWSSGIAFGGTAAGQGQGQRAATTTVLGFLSGVFV
jgi:dienelactone hydrolase